MIKQSDVQGRLNLFRYGVVVVTVTAFVASLAAPIVLTSEMGEFSPLPELVDLLAETDGEIEALAFYSAARPDQVNAHNK